MAQTLRGKMIYNHLITEVHSEVGRVDQKCTQVIVAPPQHSFTPVRVKSI